MPKVGGDPAFCNTTLFAPVRATGISIAPLPTTGLTAVVVMSKPLAKVKVTPATEGSPTEITEPVPATFQETSVVVVLERIL